MANIYDWGLNQQTSNMINLSNAYSLDKARKAQENSQAILDQKNMFEMDKMRKHEADLDQDVMFGGFLESKGADPEVAKTTLDFLRGAGLSDDVGRVKKRNMPAAIQLMNESPKFQLNVSAMNDTSLAKRESALNDEYEKLREKQYKDDPDGYNWSKNEDLQNVIKQRQAIKAKRAGIAEEMTRLQLLIDPKLREGLEEKALARQDRRDLQKDRLDAQAQRDADRNDIARERLDISRLVASVSAANAGTKQDTQKMKREMDFNTTLGKIQQEVDKLDKSWDKKELGDTDKAETLAEYNRRMKNIKLNYGKQLDSFRKDGLWHGWDTSGTVDETPKNDKVQPSKGSTYINGVLVPNT
jgi:hypothetical protein